jgi:hypothetical protein
MKRLAVVLLIAACSSTTPAVTSQLNLNRPIDISFGCYGGLRITGGNAGSAGDTVTDSAQPVSSCDIRSQPHAQNTPNPVPPGQEQIMGAPIIADPQWYAFILQSEPGTVALANWVTKPSSQFTGGEVTVIDADPLTPGNNGISVGENPVAIVTDKVGCKEVIANAGSCDMSVLDINTAIGAALSAGSGGPIVNRMQVTNGAGQPVQAAAAAMAMEPSGGTIGVDCPATATGVAYVAFPGCHLVAAVDTSTGMIKDGLQWDAAGLPTAINPMTITCPNECGGQAVTPGVRPVTLSLLFDSRVGREVLAIGADNSPVLTVVDLDTTTSLIGTNAPQQYALNTANKPDLGITSVAVSPQIGMGGTQGIINDDASAGGQAQFVYAVATDNTVRVVEIATVNKECDAQVDPRYLFSDKNIHQLSCLPVGDPATPPRRPGARGPGIELIGDSVPTSVTITRVDPVDGDARLPGDPTRLIGYFAFATAANGTTYIINIDNDDFADFVNTNSPLATPIPLDIAHQLRDAIPNRGLLATGPDPADPTGVKQVPICDTLGPNPDTGSNSGGPRSTDFPARSLPTGSIASEKVGALPSIWQVRCIGNDEPTGKPLAQTMFAAPVPVRQATFPDLRGLRGDETWTLTWEGNLSTDTGNTANNGPTIRESQMFVDGAGVHLADTTKPFCNAGVEQYDIIQLRGCDPSLGDADCSPGYTCFVHPESQVTGLGACMLKDEADRLANACKDFLTSFRTYTVGKSTNGQLDLLPRKHVLFTTPVDGCTDDAQCKTLADYSLRIPDSLNPVDDTTPADTHTFKCEADPDRAPVLGTGKRCIEVCQTSSDCDGGTVCNNGTCMEGVVPPQACVNAAQRYELHSHESFVVSGTVSGYHHPIIADAGGNCIKDPNANPMQIGRIPLAAPACDPTADPMTGKLPAGGFEANPCEEQITETEFKTTFPNVAQNSCAGGSTTVADRMTDSIKFRNRGMQLSIVDPTYPGDAVCIGDMNGNLGKVPVVTSNVQMSFRQTAGFQPYLLPIQPSMPMKVVTGPTQSIWVIDEGDFLSTSIATPSTRGKVYRVEGQAPTITNLLE